MKRRRAPLLARLLLWVLASSDVRSEMIGDLDEVHARRSGMAGWLRSFRDAIEIGLTQMLHRLTDAAKSVARGMSWPEVRIAIRSNLRHPFLTATAVAALTVGITMATSGFALLDGVLFSELPVPDGDRYVTIDALPAPGFEQGRVTPDRFRVLRAAAHGLDYLGALQVAEQNATWDDGEVLPVLTATLTSTALGRLEAGTTLGRLLTPDDAVSAPRPGVLISEAFWTDRFGRQPDVLGAQLRLGGVDYTVVGVANPDFEFPVGPDAWLAMDERYLLGSPSEAGPPVRLFGVVGAGQTHASVQARLGAASRGFDQETPNAEPVLLQVRGFTDMVGDSPVIFLFTGLLGVLVLVLLVISANIANLMVARTAARSGELAVRSALGAPRIRLVTQLFLETLLMGSTAAVIGVWASLRLLASFRGMIDEMPYWIDFSLRPHMVAFVVGITVLASAVCGLIPALRATRRDVGAHMRSGGLGSSRAFGRFSGTMIAVEMALSVALLVTALVAAQGATEYANPQFDLPGDQILTASVALSAATPEGERLSRVHDIAESLEAIPGVQAAGVADALPRMFTATYTIEVESADGVSPLPTPAPLARIGTGFLEAVGGTPSIGRGFDAADYAPDAPRVALVNQPFVAKVLNGRNGVGRRIRITEEGDAATGEPAPWIEVVGVVPDLGMSLGNPSLAGGIYLPLKDPGFVYVAARVASDAAGFTTALRQALVEVDPALTVRRVRPLEEVSSEEGRFIRGMAAAMTALGGMAMLLSLAGMYAIMSFTVTRRTREIGVRVALGAQPSEIALQITTRVARQLIVGAVLGTGLGIALLQMRAMFMFHIPDAGPLVFLTVIGVMSAAGFLAAWSPVKQALRVLPQEALRAD